MLGLLERAGDGEVDLSLVGDYLALPDTRGTGEGLMSERATGNAFGSTSCVGGVGTSVASTESSAGKDAYEKSRGLSFVGSTSIRDGERLPQAARRCACSDTTGGGGLPPPTPPAKGSNQSKNQRIKDCTSRRELLGRR